MSSVRFGFRKRHRLTLARDFDAVYAGRARASRGPVTVHTLPNVFEHPRLGLSIGRRVGGAVARNRFKRVMREVFRHGMGAVPASATGSYDIVIGLGPHEELPAEEYRRLIEDLVARSHREWSRRWERDARRAPPPHPEPGP